MKMQYNTIIYNSLKETFNFYTNEKKQLIYSKFDSNNTFKSSNLLINKTILDYSICIDKKDNIHMISLLDDGSLLYYVFIFEENKWSKNLISKLDIKSNTYKNLNLIIIKNNINIFYTSSNVISPNIWNITHIYNNENKWEKNNVTTILNGKILDTFLVDYDSFENIYAFFKAKEKESYNLYYIYYNQITKKWNTKYKKISTISKNELTYYLFIDTQNNIHLIFNTPIDKKNNKPCYKKLSSNNRQNNNWENIELPLIKNLSYPPIMFEEKNILKIIFIKGNTISYIYSKDWGNSWHSGNGENLNNNLYLTYFKHNQHNLNLKINHIYTNIGKHIKPYFINEYKHLKINNNKNYIELDKKINIKQISQKQIKSNDKQIINKNKTTKNLDTELLNNIKQNCEEIKQNVKEIKNALDEYDSNEKKSFIKKLKKFFNK